MNFFEWKRPRKKGGPPFHIFPAKEPAFRMAGLWDEWTNPETGEVHLTCTTITCEPNKFMPKLHDRMPVILGKDQLDAWFNAPPEEAIKMLKPCPPEWMTVNKVSSYVNNTRNQGQTISSRRLNREQHKKRYNIFSVYYKVPYVIHLPEADIFGLRKLCIVIQCCLPKGSNAAPIGYLAWMALRTMRNIPAFHSGQLCGWVTLTDRIADQSLAGDFSSPCTHRQFH